MPGRRIARRPDFIFLLSAAIAVLFFAVLYAGPSITGFSTSISGGFEAQAGDGFKAQATGVTGWWDTDWPLRNNITIRNSGPSTLENWTVNLTVDTRTLILAGQMQTDCDDVRFMNDSSYEFNYFVETGTCNTGSTVIWVSIPSIPAANSVNLSMYYGNTTVAAKSNVSNMSFLFADDFLGSALSTSWNNNSFVKENDGPLSNAAVGFPAPTVDGAGNLVFNGTRTSTNTLSVGGVTSGWFGRSVMGPDPTKANFTIRARMFFNQTSPLGNAADQYDFFQLGITQDKDNYTYGYQEYYDRIWVRSEIKNTISNSPPNKHLAAQNAWKVAEFVFRNSSTANSTYYIDGTYYARLAVLDNLTARNITIGFAHRTPSARVLQLVDWVFVRESSDIEPTVTIFNQELLPGEGTTLSVSPLTGTVGNNLLITASYSNTSSGGNMSDANCILNVTLKPANEVEGSYVMSYSASPARYEYSYPLHRIGTHTYSVFCSRPGFVSRANSSTITTNGSVWDDRWANSTIVPLVENGAVGRTNDLITVYAQISDGSVTNCTRELRVISNDSVEIASQIYAEKYVGNYCTSANIAFLANITANSTVAYTIYYNNPSAGTPQYDTFLSYDVSTKTLSNSKVRIDADKIWPLNDLYATIAYNDTSTWTDIGFITGYSHGGNTATWVLAAANLIADGPIFKKLVAFYDCNSASCNYNETMNYTIRNDDMGDVLVETSKLELRATTSAGWETFQIIDSRFENIGNNSENATGHYMNLSNVVLNGVNANNNITKWIATNSTRGHARGIARVESALPSLNKRTLGFVYFENGSLAYYNGSVGTVPSGETFGYAFGLMIHNTSGKTWEPVYDYYFALNNPINATLSISPPPAQASPTGRSGGSSGGGSGTIGESASTIVIGDIRAGERKAVFFTGAATVQKVSIETTQDAKNVKISVSDFTDKGPAVKQAPQADVTYKYFTIKVPELANYYPMWVDIEFKVKKGWLVGNDIYDNDVSLMRYNEGSGSWEKLSTEVTRSDNEYNYYAAQSLGFSTFAITGQKAVPPVVEQEKTAFKIPSAEERPELQRSQLSQILAIQTSKVAAFKITPVILLALALFAAIIISAIGLHSLISKQKQQPQQKQVQKPQPPKTESYTSYREQTRSVSDVTSNMAKDIEELEEALKNLK